MDLRGKITATELAEIFQLLTTTRKEGTLTVSDGTRKKSIYFSTEGVTLLFDQDKSARSLGELLVDYGRISEGELQAALQNQKSSDKRLGEVVREMGLVTAEEIEELVRTQIEEEIFDLLSWRGGTFHFRDAPAAEEPAYSVHAYTSLMFDPGSLLMEAVRRMDEWERIGQLIGTGQEVFRAVEGVEADVEEELQEARERVLPLIDGTRTSEELFHQARLPKFIAYNLLYQLHQAGALELVPPEELNQRAIDAVESGDVDQAVHWLESAVAQEPANLEFGKNLGKAYDVTGRRDRALELYAGIVAEYVRRGAHSEARPVLARMEELGSGTLPVLALETSFALAEGNLGDAVQKCLMLLRAVEDQQQREEAMTVVEQVLAAVPEHAELREAVADMLAEAGQTRPAIQEYERAAQLHAARGRSYYARGVYQRILELDSTYSAAQRQLEALAPALKRRALWLTVVGAAGAALLVVVVGWWWLGRSSDGGPVEPVPPGRQGSTPSGDSPGGDSTDVGVARAERLESEARQLESAGKLRQAIELLEEAASLVPTTGGANRYRAEVARLTQLLGEARAQLERARGLEEQGDYQRARREYLELCVRYGFAVTEFAVLLPVPVRTVPQGARVLVDGREEGTTPLVLHLPPYKQVALSLECPGHEGFQTQLSSDTVGELERVLPRRSHWSYQLRAGLTAGPCAGTGRVFVVGGDRAVRAVSVEEGSEFWQAPLDGQVTAAPVLAGDVLVLASRDGTVYGLEAATGEEKWRFPAGDAFKGSPRYGSRWGLVFLGGLDRNIYCLDGQTGDERWRFATSGNLEASPAVVDDLVICGGLGGKLTAVEATTGELRWEVETGGPVATAVAVDRDSAYVVNLDNHVMACSLAEGGVRWRYRSDQRVTTGVCLAGGVLCFGTGKDELVGLDVAQGGVRWRVPRVDGGLASLASGGDLLWVGGGDGSLACVDGATGETLWKAQVEGAVSLPVWVGEKRLYVATARGVWSFDR